MPVLLEGDMKLFQQKKEQEEKYWDQWTKNRNVKKCSCGNAYSYEKGYPDPGMCLECRKG